MRVSALAIILMVAAQAARPAVPSEHSGRARYLRDMFGKTAWLHTAAGAAIQHIRNSPKEWGRGAEGLGKRVGSGLGEHAVKGTIQFAVAGIRHEELGYRPSGKQGFGPRLKYALLSSFVTRKTTTGQRTFAAGRVSGALGSGLVSRLWQPARLHTVTSGLASGGIMLGADAGVNAAREFWPDIRHRRH
jgi:hypothetical protein